MRDLGFWGNGSVTLGPGVVIRGGVGRIGQHRGIGGSGQVINQGTISADVAGKTINIEPTNQTANSFTNSGGTLEAKNGGTLAIVRLAGNLGNASLTGTGSSLSLDGTGWTNNATLAIPTGTTATLNGTWTNAGTLALNGGTLNLGGTFTTAGLGAVTRTGGTTNLRGTLDNAAAAITLGTTLGPWNMDGGTISGGTVNLADGQSLNILSDNGNRLIGGVTLNGDLNLTQTSALVRVSGGLTLNGTAHLTGGDVQVLFEGPNTVNAGTFVFDGTSSSVRDLGFWGNGSVTFAPGVVIRGGVGRIGQHRGIGGTGFVTNQGRISADVSGKVLEITPTNQAANNFTNAAGGVAEATNGGTLNISRLQPNVGTVLRRGVQHGHPPRRLRSGIR